MVSSCTRLDSSEDHRRFWMMYLYDTVTLDSPWEWTLETTKASSGFSGQTNQALHVALVWIVALTMSSTLYFSGPLVWSDCWFSLWIYSQATPFSITTRDSGSSSLLLRKKWSVSWFFSAGARNNKGFPQNRQQRDSLILDKISSSYPGCEESPGTPGSASVAHPLEFPLSSGNLDINLVIFQEAPLIQCCMMYLLWSNTFLLGTAGKVSFDDFTAGIVPATDATSIFLLVRSDLSITTYMLHWDSNAG